MKKQVNILIALIIIILLSSVELSFEANSNKITIATSLNVLKNIVKRIGGSRVEAFSIIPSNVDPHEFTLTPEIIMQASSVDLIVIDGHVEWEYELVEQVARNKGVDPGKIVINLMDYKENMTILDIPPDMGVSGKNYHGYWILPENVLTIARIICERLSQLDPDGRQYYNENLKGLSEEISTLNRLIENLRFKSKGRNAILGFLSEQYMAYLFNLNITVILSLEEGISPTPRSIYRAYEALRGGGLIIISDVSANMPVYNKIIELSKQTKSPIVEVKIIGDFDYTLMMMYNIGKIEATISEINIIEDASEGGLNNLIIIAISIPSIIALIEFIQIHKLRGKIYGYSKS